MSLAFGNVDASQDEGAADEEENHQHAATRLDPKMLTDAANSAGPAMPANFSKTEKNPKYSDDLCFGSCARRANN